MNKKTLTLKYLIDKKVMVFATALEGSGVTAKNVHEQITDISTVELVTVSMESLDIS